MTGRSSAPPNLKEEEQARERTLGTRLVIHIGQVSVPQFGAVYTGVHTILDRFSCQHEKLSVTVSTWPRNILPVSHINCKNEYLDT